VLRRPAESWATILQVGPLNLDLIERTAKRGDRVIELSPREFPLLENMMRRKDQMLTRGMRLEDDLKFSPCKPISWMFIWDDFDIRLTWRAADES
jgi:two-component system, OmpR family, response regulator